MNIQMSKNEMINIISLFTEKANASGLIEPMIAWEMKEAITPKEALDEINNNGDDYFAEIISPQINLGCRASSEKQC
jgi:hypothetical protein